MNEAIDVTCMLFELGAFLAALDLRLSYDVRRPHSDVTHIGLIERFVVVR